MLPPVRKRILSRVLLLERKFYTSSMSIQSADTSCQDDRTLLLCFRVDACPQRQAPAGEGQIFPWRIPHTASACFAREIDVIYQDTTYTILSSSSCSGFAAVARSLPFLLRSCLVWHPVL